MFQFIPKIIIELQMSQKLSSRGSVKGSKGLNSSQNEQRASEMTEDVTTTALQTEDAKVTKKPRTSGRVCFSKLYIDFYPYVI